MDLDLPFGMGKSSETSMLAQSQASVVTWDYVVADGSSLVGIYHWVI